MAAAAASIWINQLSPTRRAKAGRSEKKMSNIINWTQEKDDRLKALWFDEQYLTPEEKREYARLKYEYGQYVIPDSCFDN